MLDLFERCPACGGAIVVRECRCSACQLEMRGDFRPGPFSALSAEQATFVRVLLRARGNLTEMEKVLGVSYPTIRNKLDEVNRVLEAADAERAAQRSAPAPTAPVEPSAAIGERRQILQDVAAGRLSAAEALSKLRDQAKGGS